MIYLTVNEVFEQLGIERKESETLRSMTVDQILNMTPEQAQKICEEVGTGWVQSTNDERIEFLNNATVNSDGSITINFELPNANQPV